MPLRARESVRVLSVLAILILGCGPGAIELSARPLGVPAAPSPSPSALAAFERFRAMDGTWEGRSTKGWQESISFKTIAGGSAVVETSFDAHPGETMLTVFHLDGEDLTLTHYCIAKNQPRLRATEISADGRSVSFTFAGGGNLADRNRGHMDSAVFRFEDADHVSSRWTWYQDGKERWLEEIRLERRPTGR